MIELGFAETILVGIATLLSSTALTLVLYLVISHILKKRFSKSLGKGFGRFSYGKNPKWFYSGEQKTVFLKICTGLYINPEANKVKNDKDGSQINIYLGSIMRLADNEEQALLHLEETVLHELTHWGARHNPLSGNGSKKGHAENYFEVIRPLVNPESDYNPHKE